MGRALSAPDGASSCGAVSYQGCCTGETTQVLHYCAGGKLVSQPCGPGKCGWDKVNSLYACGASDGADPSGKVPRACPSADGGKPDGLSAPDATVSQDLASCGALGYVGCCSGSTLFFCAGGKVLALSCAASPLCGWNGNGGFYDCGTAGQADPSGKNPKVCAMPLADAGPTDTVPDGPKEAGVVKDRRAEALPLDSVRRESLSSGDRARQDGQPHDEGSAEAGVGLDLTRLDGSGGDLGAPPTGSEGCGCMAPGARPVALFPELVVVALAAAIALRIRRRRR